MNSWNDYLWQLVIISERYQKTLPLGIAGLQNEFVPDYGILFAGAAIAAFPMIIIFLIFQRYFTRGITLGAVKG
jgi:multiple sugar transport system permease protein